MSKLKIETLNGRTAFTPGEEIEIIAGWELDEAPEAIEVRLLWYTAGKGTRDVSLAHTERFEAVNKLDGRRFQMKLPAAPYSFSGKLISLLWTLELVVEPSNESERIAITLAPGAQEIVLHPEGAADAEASDFVP